MSWFGQDGSGDIKNIFRIALLSQSALFAVSLSRSVVVDHKNTVTSDIIVRIARVNHGHI